jgi:hypothetical protein
MSAEAIYRKTTKVPEINFDWPSLRSSAVNQVEVFFGKGLPEAKFRTPTQQEKEVLNKIIQEIRAFDNRRNS